VQNRNLKDDSLNSLRAIYTEIIRPLVGDVFDINAALSTDNLFQERFSYDRTQNKGKLDCIYNSMINSFE